MRFFRKISHTISNIRRIPQKRRYRRELAAALQSATGFEPSRRSRHVKKRLKYIMRRTKALRIVVLAACICVAVVLLWPFISGRPRMKLVGKATVITAQGETYADEGATARIYRRDVSDRLYSDDQVDTSVPGTGYYVYHVDGRWKTYTIKRTVKVKDLTAPEVSLNGEDFMFVEDDFSNYTEPGATALDNCDGDMTDSITVTTEEPNDYTHVITYSATDTAGNTGTVTREVQIRDPIGPEIALAGDDTMTITQNDVFEDPGYTATDNRDGDITENVEISGYVNYFRVGTYILTYTVADASGNEYSIDRTVEVKEGPAVTDHAIYLTFDDGPSESVTPEILDILQENDVKATFFILKYSEDKLPLLQREYDEGHTIGIHGYSHKYSDIYTSVEAFMDSINRLSDMLYEDIGYQAFCLRFPGGSGNTVSRKYCEGIMTDLTETVEEEGWSYFDWNVDSSDADTNGQDPKTILATIESELNPNGCNIILMHDASTKQTTADALQSIIDYGKENGYRFYPITEQTAPIHQGINN